MMENALILDNSIELDTCTPAPELTTPGTFVIDGHLLRINV